MSVSMNKPGDHNTWGRPLAPSRKRVKRSQLSAVAGAYVPHFGMYAICKVGIKGMYFSDNVPCAECGGPSSHAQPVVGYQVRLESYRGDEAADIEGH